MVTLQAQERPVDLSFNGSKAEQELAKRLLGLMLARGRFMSADTPIRVSVSSIVDFLTAQGDTAAVGRLEAAISANPIVFAVEERGEERVVVTTRAGRVPVARPTGLEHSFAQRFITPLPKPEQPVQPVRERPRVDPSWASLPAVLGGLDFDDEEPETDQEPEVEQEVAAAVAAPPIVVPEPVMPPISVPVAVASPTVPTAVETAAPVPSPVERAAVAPTMIEPMPEPEPEPEPEPAVAAAAIEPEPEPEPVPVPAPALTRTITLPVATPTDITGVDDLDLAAAIARRLQADPRVANFGEQWLIEDRVPRFSRGDVRRIKDYIQEQEQPLTDDVLVQDVLGIRPSTPDFELMRFAVNFRLSREHREFEFVGTTGQRFWSTSGLPQIGTTRRKPNELGTDYRFLLDETPEPVAPRSIPAVDHVLTFYEYVHGLLPYDADLQRLLPAPLVSNQRSAVLTFETPQSYTTYLVELRYPTPNRGGFILGLDDFYTENLVPGAIVSITRTENDGHYRVEYLAEKGQNARLLELDERRAQRYVFRPTTYASGVDERMLLTEERFGRIGGDKPLDEKVRRRPEAVVAATFERVGDDREGNYSAEFDLLLAGVNIERPMSPTLLRTVLDHDDTGAFSRDPDGIDAYTYVPGTTP